eukprot:1242619-Prymnesium_polylepis.1
METQRSAESDSGMQKELAHLGSDAPCSDPKPTLVCVCDVLPLVLPHQASAFWKRAGVSRTKASATWCEPHLGTSVTAQTRPLMGVRLDSTVLTARRQRT